MINTTRKTKETDISLDIDLYPENQVVDINTGIGFFDHMLIAFATHSGISLQIKVDGDLYVDSHHTIEDTGIVLGKSINKCLGDKSGIERYATTHIPMDEALAFASIDISGRPFLVFDADFKNPKIGEMDTQMVEEFFRAVSYNSLITLHIKLLYGVNDHHIAEAIFKSFAHAFKNAIKKSGNINTLSTKGMID